jgi:hypothetical protein
LPEKRTDFNYMNMAK